MADYFAVLAQRIDEIQTNPAESRWVIYELARSTLRKQVYLAQPPLTREQVREQITALEEAIARVEAAALQDDMRRLTYRLASAVPAEPIQASSTPPDELRQAADAPPDEPPAAEGGPPEAAEPHSAPSDAIAVEPYDQFDPWNDLPRSSRGEIVLAPNRLVDERAAYVPVGAEYYRPPGGLPTYDFGPPPPEPPPAAKPGLLSMIGSTLQIMIASLGAVAIYAAVSNRSGAPVTTAAIGPERPTAESPATFAERVPATALPVVAAPAQAAAPPSPYPLPAMYGVYAVANNQLVPLEQVSTGPVDPRTRTTLQITKPSRITLSDGKLSFILYRRDLLTSAPDKVPVRIAARITRTMNFDSNGRAVIVVPPNESWLVREVGYDLRVLPVRESQEMVYVRPEDSEFSFPAGRYVLMFNGQPYDFTVEGTVTNPEHCVEGFATVRGPAFHECKPQSG